MNSDKVVIVKEGWLFKRGEYIKNWRQRYFVLSSDGTFYGYKDKPNKFTSKPLTMETLPEPLNNFSILNSTVIKVEKPKPNSFIVRCFQLASLIERLFHLETKDERDSWVDIIKIITERNQKKQNEAIKKLAAENTSENEAKEDYLPNEPKVSINDFEMMKVIGRGTFGKVILARERATNDIVAIKLIKKEIIIEKDELEHTLTENKVLLTSRHPFLICMKYSFQTSERLCFVMEFVNGGELFFHLSREKLFSESRSRFYGAEITLALKYLHEHKIVYRDLKLENLLLDSEGHIKIADFGLCKQDVGHGDKMKTFCGTPEYLAPEVIEDNDYSRAVDWWGLGIVMYEMLCGRLPFFNRDHEVLFELILTKEISYTPTINDLGKSLVNGLLNKNPKQRLGGGPRDAIEVMRHAFFEKLDWDDIYNKKVRPPFVPNLSSKVDTKYFDKDFTDEPLVLTPPRKSVELDIDLGE